MANTIGVALVADTPLPHVQIDVEVDATATGWTVTRAGGGQVAEIRIDTDGLAADSFRDYTAPLGAPTTYTLNVSYGDGTAASITSTPITLVAPGCYVTAPSSGRTMRVTLVGWPERLSVARQSVLEVGGRPDPVVLSDAHTAEAGQWTFYTTTDPDTANLISLLKSQRIAVLRTQPTSSIVSTTATVGDITERRFSRRGTDQRRWIDVAVQEIGTLPATALPLDATLQGLHNLVPTTLVDLAALRPTLIQLSQLPTPGGP